MPRKRTHRKRRLDRHAGADAWADVFEFGFAVFDDFTAETGVETEAGGKVPDSTAWAAWQAYGPTFIEAKGRQLPAGKPLWALQQFGEPHAG